ncbi:hypothetical protein ACQ4PT_020327 [Festuca glaucescens]
MAGDTVAGRQPGPLRLQVRAVQAPVLVPGHGNCVCIAKGAAETLKLNMALILLPVCRNTLTTLRSTALSHVIPFDDNINFHKVLAGSIAIGTTLHTLAHVTCDFPRLISYPNDRFMPCWDRTLTGGSRRTWTF